MNKIKVILSDEAQKFIDSQTLHTRAKIYSNLDRVKAGIIDNRLFKKLTPSGIWEFRTSYENKEYRILSFWDKQQKSIVIATNGFIKKTQKTPTKEIARAEQIMKEYYFKK